MNLKITGLNFDVTEAIKTTFPKNWNASTATQPMLFPLPSPFLSEKLNQQAEADIHLAGQRPPRRGR